MATEGQVLAAIRSRISSGPLGHIVPSKLSGVLELMVDYTTTERIGVSIGGLEDNDGYVRMTEEERANIAFLMGDSRNIKQRFGVTGIGDAADLAAWKTALENGSTITVPPGNYSIPATINVTMANHVKLILSPDARIIPASGIGGKAFNIDGADTYRFDVVGGRYDLSEVSNLSPGGNVGTMFHFSNLTAWSVCHADAWAGADYSEALGDSFVAAVDCGQGLVIGCRVVGFGDCGFYITGDNDSGDGDNGGPTLIIGNTIIACATGIASKRKNENLFAIANRIKRCSTGVGLLEVGSGEMRPGERAVINGNYFWDNAEAIRLNGPARSVVTANTVEDFGYTIAGSAVASPKAINLSGSVDTLVHGNMIRMRDRTAPTSSVGVMVQTWTNNSIDYVPSGNSVRFNRIDGLHYGIYEGAGVGASDYRDNEMSNVTTEPVHRTGSSIVGETWAMTAIRAQSIAFGTVASGTQSGTVTLTCTGARNGDVVHVTPLTSNDPRITLSARAVTDGVQVRLQNGTGSSLDTSTLTWTVAVSRRDQ